MIVGIADTHVVIWYLYDEMIYLIERGRIPVG